MRKVSYFSLYHSTTISQQLCQKATWFYSRRLATRRLSLPRGSLQGTARRARCLFWTIGDLVLFTATRDSGDSATQPTISGSAGMAWVEVLAAPIADCRPSRPKNCVHNNGKITITFLNPFLLVSATAQGRCFAPAPRCTEPESALRWGAAAMSESMKPSLRQ